MKETKDKFITLRLPASIMDQIKAEAQRETRTLNSQILHYLKSALQTK